MSRWEPNARGRLVTAALDLYTERGFEQTTVAEIARRAGLTERTFFRYFADKREVLFWGQEALQEAFVSAVTNAADDETPLGAVAGALAAVGAIFEGHRDGSRQRQAVIAANAELRERELTKLATLAAATADALRARGVGDLAAIVAAEAGIAVFRVVFARWTAAPDGPDWAQVVQDSLEALAVVTAGSPVLPR